MSRRADPASSVLDARGPVEARPVVASVTLEGLAESHPPREPIFVMWHQEKRQLSMKAEGGAVSAVDLIAFYLTVCSVREKRDHVFVMNLGYYDLDREGRPVDQGYADLLEARAREVREAAVGYLEHLGLKVEEGKLCFVEGLILTEGRINFLGWDDEAKAWTYPAEYRRRRPARKAAKRGAKKAAGRRPAPRR